MCEKRLETVKTALSRLPRWILTILTTLLILWLTLSPDPFGGHSPGLFPGSDKVAHLLMFGFLTAMALTDKARQTGWRLLRWAGVAGVASAAAVFGALIEVAQLLMGMGRGFEYADMAADAIGVALSAAGWWMLQPRLCGPPDSR